MVVPCSAKLLMSSPSGIGVRLARRVRITDCETSGTVSSRPMAAAAAPRDETPGTISQSRPISSQSSICSITAPYRLGSPECTRATFRVLLHRPLVELAHAFERYGRRLDDLGTGSGVLEDALLDEASGPDHHVGLADEPGPPDRQQVRRPRPRPYEPHLTQARNSSR